MYLGGVISGPKDGVISDRNLRTRRQNEFDLLAGCCGGASRSDSNPPQQPQTLDVCRASARVRSCLNSRTGWKQQRRLQVRRSTSSPAGGPQQGLETRALYGVFSSKNERQSPQGRVKGQTPLRSSSKTRSFCSLAINQVNKLKFLSFWSCYFVVQKKKTKTSNSCPKRTDFDPGPVF